jgi:hypothetical protein
MDTTAPSAITYTFGSDVEISIYPTGGPAPEVRLIMDELEDGFTSVRARTLAAALVAAADQAERA